MADYQYTFDSGVYAVTAMGSPAPINTGQNSTGRGGTFPLTAANNSFQLVSAGKINHEQVEGVLFNYQSTASSAPFTGYGSKFELLSPGDPAFPDLSASATISLSTGPGKQSATTALSGSLLRLVATNGNVSSFYAVASGGADTNTGAGSNAPGSVFYTCTGTNVQVLESLARVINDGDPDKGSFKATLAHRGHELVIEQRLGGLDGNSTSIFVSGALSAAHGTSPAGHNVLSSVIVVDKLFTGGQNEQSDMTLIRAAAGKSPGYDATTVAVVTDTGRTVTYTLGHDTGPKGTVTPVQSGFNLAVGPNMRRQVNMGMR